MAAEWARRLDRRAGLEHQGDETCPACGALGIIEGDEVLDTQVEAAWGPMDGGESDVTLTVYADYFSCPTCRLVLDRVEFLAQAGLPEQFETEGDLSDLHPDGEEYGND